MTWPNLNRLLSLFCFLLGIAFATPAVWLCLRGEIPAIPIQDDTVVMPVELIRIYDLPVGRWAYPVTLAGLFAVAVLLFFAGWRVGKRRTHEAA